MPNTQAIGVAFADPEFQSVDVTGAVSAASVSASTVTASGSLVIKSATVAAAGSNQGTAAAVAAGFTLVTGADAAKGVVLPAASAGLIVIIKNADAANAVLKVYPASGDAINALAANASYDMAAKTSVLLVAYDSTTWYSVPLLAS
jgi:lipopolysaccharide export system protein LptA